MSFINMSFINMSNNEIPEVDPAREYEMKRKKFQKRVKKIKNADELNDTWPGIYETETPITVFKKINCNQGKRYFNKLLGHNTYPSVDRNCIAELIIPEDSKIVISTNNHKKYRTNQAYVKNIESDKFDNFGRVFLRENQCYSKHDSYFKYKIGETVLPNTFSENDEQCGGGIHFFATKKGAQDYYT